MPITLPWTGQPPCEKPGTVPVSSAVMAKLREDSVPTEFPPTQVQATRVTWVNVSMRI